MFTFSSNEIKAGDKLMGPFQGGMITVPVGTVLDLQGSAVANLQPEGMLRQLWPDLWIDLGELPSGWRHVRGAKTLNKGE